MHADATDGDAAAFTARGFGGAPRSHGLSLRLPLLVSVALSAFFAASRPVITIPSSSVIIILVVRVQVAATADKLGAVRANPEEAPADPALEQARDKLDAGDFDGAGAAYQAILDADPGHAEAKGALRQIGFLRRATTHSPGAVAAADAAPDDIDAAFAAADVQVLSQDVAGACARLTALVKRTAGDERARVRTRLIELFELFDPADPDVIAGRRNLANALY